MADILKPGTVDSGFKFLGGDPSDSRNWEPEGLKVGTVDQGFTFIGGDPNLKDSWVAQPESDFLRGAEVSLKQTPAIAKGLVGLAGKTAESFLGEGGVSTAVKDWGLQGYEEGMRKLKPMQKESDELTKAWDRAKEGDIGALLDWAQYGLGYMVGQVGEAAATAVIGGAVGGAMAGPGGAAGGVVTGAVAKGAVREFASSLIEKAVAKEAATLIEKAGGKLAAEEATKLATKNVAKDIGATTALVGMGTGKELGSIYPEAEAEAAKRGEELTGLDLARVWGTGIAAGGLEGLTDKLGLGLLSGKTKLGATTGAAIGERMGGATGAAIGARAGGAAGAAGLGALAEGGTEFVQTGLERLGAQQELTSQEALESYINAAGLGAIGGGGIGLIGGALSRQRPEAEVLNDLNNAKDVASTVTAANELAGNLDTLTAATTAYLAQPAAPTLTPDESIELAAAKGAMERVGSLDLGAGPSIIAPPAERAAAADAALREVEAAGGVATPAQAAIIDAAFPGRQMYDTVQAPAAAPAAGGLIEVPEIRAPRSTTVQGAAAAANAEGFAELQARQAAATAAPAPTPPVAPAPPSAQTVIQAFATPGFQRTAEQKTTLTAANQAYSPEDLETMQLAATAPFRLDANQKVRLQVLRQETGPQLSPERTPQLMEALAVTPVMRTPEQQAVVSQARDSMPAEDFEILRVGAMDPAMLEPAQVPRFEALSQQAPVVPEAVTPQAPVVPEAVTAQATAGTVTPDFVAQMASTPERPFTAADVQVVDTNTLDGLEKQNFRLIDQISRVFGKKVVVFDGLADLKADGFVNPQDTNTIFLNRNSQMPHLAVFGHEMLHLLRRDSPETYNAFSAVVQRNLDEQGRAAFKAEYGETGEVLEEISADLMGNRFRDATFWTETFNEIAAQHSAPQSQGIITKLAGALYAAVDKAVSALRGQGFRADQYVKDLNQIKAAAKTALKTYAQQRRIPAMQMELDVAKNVRAMDNVSKANIGAENAGLIYTGLLSPTRQNRPEPTGDRGDQEAVATGYGVARDGAIQVEGVHYSREQRGQLNSEFWGTGLKGDEGRRLANTRDSRLRQRIYFYVNTGKGIKPEEGVGAYPHTAKLNNIYDPATRLISPQSDENAFETAVIDAGFDGYINRAFGAVVLLGRHAVPVVPGAATAQAPAAPVVETTRTKLQGLRSLPAGELSRERWGQVLKTTAPDIYAELEPTGAFQGEERVYKDQLPKLSPVRRETAQAIEDIAGIENAFAKAREGSFNTNRELKVFIQNAVREAAGKKDLAAAKDYLVKVGVKDALYALASNANAVGWYDTTVTKALNILATIHPEIKTDPNAKFAFTWALAVTSNGLKVDKNFELAERAYRGYKATGKMPVNIQAGQAQKAINESMKLFNDMVAQYGIEDLRKFMSDKFKVSQIERVTGVKVTGEFKDTEVRGAAILGPKIGNGFFSNLNGFFDQLTMDRWLMRTWGRWTGTLIEARPDMVKQKRDELNTLVREIKKNPKATLEFQKALGRKLTLGDPDALAAAIQKASMKPEIRAEFNKTEVGENIRKTGNSLAKYLDGQKEAPDGPAERNAIREVFGEILQKVRDQGYEALTMSDLQALLWYPEKRLYDVAKSDEATEGYADDEAPDYANAAAKLARDMGVSEQEIKNAGTAGTERGAGEGPVQAGTEERDAGFAPKERRAFLLRGVLQSYRDADGAAQPYTRASNRGARGLRVLGQEAVAQFKPATKFKNALESADAPAPKFFELGAEGAALFSDSIKASKDSSVYGAAVYVYPEEDYRDMRLFLTEDGKSGFALKGDDIVSVFSGEKGASTAMLQLAVQEGGRRLDAFDTALPDIYSVNGFKVVARLAWNDEYRPADWNKATFNRYNNGEPDVVFMVYDPANASPEGGIEVQDYDEGNALQREAVGIKERPVLSRARGLESVFEGLNGRGLALRRAQAAAASHPAAAQITFVQDNFYDILAQLEDSGRVEINCD